MQKVPIPKLQNPFQSGEVYQQLEYFLYLLTINLTALIYAVQG